MIAVIDASALIRLFVPDGPVPKGLEVFLRAVEMGNHSAIAPELILAEVGNVLNKKRLRNELTTQEAVQILEDIIQMPIRLLPHKGLMQRALELAGSLETTVYDALYLALAVEHSAGVFTADAEMERLAESLHLCHNIGWQSTSDSSQ